MLIVGRGRRRRRHRISRTASDDRNCGRCDSPTGDDVMASRYSSSCTRAHRWKYWTMIVSSALIVFTTATETSSNDLHSAWRSSSASLRNIRHLPCVSRRTGETGLCMFAYTCAKANGTHLGTCIDRFYFGSCCKINANSDPDLVDPIMHNYLNKDETSSSSSPSSIKTPPYQRPSSSSSSSSSSSGMPSDFSFGIESSSAMSIPVSISSMSRPLSTIVSHVPPSSTTDLFTTMFVKQQGSSKPASAYSTSSVSYETVPVTSRTPVVNVTMSQSYSTTPATLVTSSLSTVFHTGTHKPLPVFQTTAYSKPFTVTKPTSKPGTKPKPSVAPGKPSSTKPKPIKPITKPSLFTAGSYSSTESLFNSPYANKTTIYQSSNGFASSKPFYTTENSVPMKTSSRPSSSQAIPTPITSFTSLTSKKPTKPTKPPTIYTSTQSSTTYIKIPPPTHSQTNRPLNTMTPSSMFASTYFGSTIANTTIEQHVKFNSTDVDDNEISPEKPPKPWTSSTSMFSTRPWMTQSSTSSTPSQPALVTWTTLEQMPVVPAEMILPDRKPPKPLVKPTSPKPTIIPTYSKPLVSSTGRPTSGRPPSKPTTTPENAEEDNPPPITMTLSSTSTTASPSWVKVPITTHPAPTIGSHTSNMPTTETQDQEGMTMTMISQSKPSSTSVTIPVVSPLPMDTTPVPPPIDTNEVESSGLNMSDYKAVCGRRIFPTARIVGGEKSTFGKWPWQISLRQWRTSTYLHKCGAALFNENWAVTAAHCVENVPPGDLLLRLGEYDLSIDEEPYGYQERRVQIVASHPQFDPRTFEYDLALLRFYEPVRFQPNIVPICVPEDDTNFVGSQAFVTGWGRLYEDGPLPSVLQEVSVPVINNTVCESMYQSAGYIEHIPNIFICAGWKKGGYDSCEGDSGGPMVIQRPDKRWLLAGIISWGIGCAEPNQPGVYTRISEFRDWINQILQF